MKTKNKKLTYFGTLTLLAVLPLFLGDTVKLNNETDHQDSLQMIDNNIDSTWREEPWAANFTFSLDEELNFRIEGSNPLGDELYQRVYIGFQDSENTSKTWTPETHVIENEEEIYGWFRFEGNVVDILGIDVIPEEWLSKESINVFVGYKDFQFEFPSEDLWQEEIFTEETRLIKNNISSDYIIGNILDLNAIDDSVTETSTKVEFNLDEGFYYNDNVSYKLNDDTAWIDIPSITEGENEILVENINPFEKNTINFRIGGIQDNEVYYAKVEHEFKVDIENPVVTDLSTKNITSNSADIDFNVQLGNTNNNFTYRTIKNENPEDWVAVTPTEGSNTINLTNLTEGDNYTFELKNQGVNTYSIEFTTLKHSAITNLTSENIGLTSAEITFDVEMGDSSLNDKFFHRTMEENGIYNDWTEFTPTEGANKIDLAELTSNTEYSFEVKVDGVNTYSTEFTTLRNSVVNNLTLDDVGTTTAEISFNVELGDTSLNEEFFYRTFETDSSTFENWIEFEPVEGENTIELTDLTANTDYSFEIKVDGADILKKTEFTTLRHSAVNELTVDNIGTTTAEISFNVQLGDQTQNETFYYRALTDSKSYDDWTEFTPTNGANTIELTGLTEGTNYIFEINIDGAGVTKRTEFTTLKYSTVNNLTPQNIGTTSGKITFNVQLENSVPNEKFYYRVIENNVASDDWIEFSPVDGENTIELEELKENTDYSFELKIEGSDTYSTEFKTSKPKSSNLNTILLSTLVPIGVLAALFGFKKLVLDKRR